MGIENDDWSKDARKKTNIRKCGLPRTWGNFEVGHPK